MGIDYYEGVEIKNMKKRLTHEYFRRIRAILKTEFTPKNKFTVISTLAAPVIQYSFEIIKWTRKLDTKTTLLIDSASITPTCIQKFRTIEPSQQTNQISIARKENLHDNRRYDNGRKATKV